MDQELVQYLDERFGGIDRRFEQIDQRFGQIDQRFGQIDQRFEQVDQRFGQVDQRFGQIDQRFGQIDQHFESVDGQTKGLRQEMCEGFDEAKRHFGILAEDLRRQLQLVAEGLMTHIDVRHAEDRAYADEHFRENRTLFKLCFQRIENLERKGRG